MNRRSPRPGALAFRRSPAAQRALTFYSEDGGSWPHLGPIVLELLERGREVTYLTSARDDAVFDVGHDRLHTYAVGEGFRRALLFQTLDVQVLVATVPQLGASILPRSRNAEANGTQYVYVFHSMTSTHMIYEPDGFDQYDIVLCVGPYMVDEIRRREELHGLRAKELVPHGYARLDALRALAAAPPANDPPVVLVAPSWGPTCLFETCGRELISVLLDAGYHVVARPHPMTRKRTPDAIPSLIDAFRGHARFELDEHIAAKDSLLRADVMVSDWSGAALEFAFGLERPVLFVDVPRKVNNPAYDELGIEPFEVHARDTIGAVLAPSDLGDAPALVTRLLDEREAYAKAIAELREECIFNVGSSATVAADAIEAALGPTPAAPARSAPSTTDAPSDATPPEEDDLLNLDNAELFTALAERQPDTASTDAAIDVSQTVAAWLRDGPRVFVGDDRATLDALCRQVDVRKRVSRGYGPDFAKLDPETNVEPVVMSGLVAVLLANAGSVAEPPDDGSLNDGWALKCVNTALKALQLSADLPGDPSLRAWALEILDQANRPDGATA